MIKIDNVDIHGIARAVFSARNAFCSWELSDSNIANDTLGANDLDLAERLVKAGTDHSKFMRMITVTADITAPLYYWKQISTYKVGTTANSTSTMHTIHKYPFSIDMFAHEHLDEDGMAHLESTIQMLNMYRNRYIRAKSGGVDDVGVKDIWWNLIQILPTNYLQMRTLCCNYQVLRNMYHSRKNHKLDEWVDFCKWIETLPYANELLVS